MPRAVRPLRSQVEADWCRLWTGHLAFYKTAVPEAVCQSTCARLLRMDQHHFDRLVAELDGKVIGLPHYLSHRHARKIEDMTYSA